MRIPHPKAAPILCAAIVATISSFAHAATFTPLGFLTDTGDTNFATRASVADGVSADGSTVVGWSTADSSSGSPNTDSSHEAFIWTSTGGLKGIGTISGAPTPYTSEATSANSDGSQVAGFGDAPDPNDNTVADTKGFRYTTSSGSFTDLGALGSALIQSHAYAISGDGNTVVGSSYDSTNNLRPFFYRDSNSPNKMVLLPGFGATNALHGGAARGVNTDGSEIVGQEVFHSSNTSSNQENATVGALWVISGGTAQAPVELQDFSSVISPQLYQTVANGISADGTRAVGLAVSSVTDTASNTTTQNITQAVEWAIHVTGSTATADAPVGLGFIDGTGNSATLSSIADATSMDGSIVVGKGLTTDHSGTPHNEAFIWFGGKMQDLEDYLTGLSPSLATELSGWTLTEATGISSDGATIVGVGTHPDPSNPSQTLSEGFVVKLPEPASMSLLALGGLALRRRKSRPKCHTTI